MSFVEGPNTSGTACCTAAGAAGAPASNRRVAAECAGAMAALAATPRAALAVSGCHALERLQNPGPTAVKAWAMQVNCVPAQRLLAPHAVWRAALPPRMGTSSSKAAPSGSPADAYALQLRTASAEVFACETAVTAPQEAYQPRSQRRGTCIWSHTQERRLAVSDSSTSSLGRGCAHPASALLHERSAQRVKLRYSTPATRRAHFARSLVRWEVAAHYASLRPANGR
jgi:hypothetical protein